MTNAPQGPVQPVAHARSAIDWSVRDPIWGSNWEDDLASAQYPGFAWTIAGWIRLSQ